MLQYEERYVAFIDVLGFKSLVDRAEADAKLLERLATNLEEVRTYSALGATMDASAINDPENFFHNMFRMSTFSDSIIISTKINLIGLGLIAMLSGIMCNKLLHQGIFTRGAISAGKLIHTESIAFGAGLIRSYSLENSAAIYPRILIDERIVHDMDALAKQGGSPELRRQDFDGLWHLHILHSSLSHNAASDSKELDSEYMALARQEIEDAFRSAENLAVKAKIFWLARYFNEYADSLGLRKIQTAE